MRSNAFSLESLNTLGLILMPWAPGRLTLSLSRGQAGCLLRSSVNIPYSTSLIIILPDERKNWPPRLWTVSSKLLKTIYLVTAGQFQATTSGWLLLNNTRQGCSCRHLQRLRLAVFDLMRVCLKYWGVAARSFEIPQNKHTVRSTVRSTLSPSEPLPIFINTTYKKYWLTSSFVDQHIIWLQNSEITQNETKESLGMACWLFLIDKLLPNLKRYFMKNNSSPA